ncbi:hypothetical protein Peur_001239 [Populus x canadensis]
MMCRKQIDAKADSSNHEQERKEYIIFLSSHNLTSTLKDILQKVTGSTDSIGYYKVKFCIAKLTEGKVRKLASTYEVSIVTTKLLDYNDLIDK